MEFQREIPVSFQDHWNAKNSSGFSKFLSFAIILVCEVHLLPWGKYAPNMLLTFSKHKLTLDFSSTLQNWWISKPWRLEYLCMLRLFVFCTHLVTLSYSWKFSVLDSNKTCREMESERNYPQFLHCQHGVSWHFSIVSSVLELLLNFCQCSFIPGSRECKEQCTFSDLSRHHLDELLSSSVD